MITVTVPNNNIKERKYIVDVFFKSFLGLEYVCNYTESHDYIIEVNKKKIVIEDHFFNKFPKEKEYLKEANIPETISILNHALCTERNIPVLYGHPRIAVESDRITCGADIFASSFFMLTRWEEFVIKERDVHGRFFGKLALSYKKGFLKRPVVNEYTELLWNLLTYMDPSLRRRHHTYQLVPTHDIDIPIWGEDKSLFRWLRSGIADLLVRKDPGLAVKRSASFFLNRRGNYRYDVANSYSFIFQSSGDFNLISRFYFIADRSYSIEDGKHLDLRHPRVIDLLKEINIKKHEVGLHPGYHSSRNPGAIKAEKEALEAILKENGINQVIKGGRQHYLRWEAPDTWQEWEDAGLEYDSTLGYADVTGFRCGTCYAYPVFNFLSQTVLKLMEQPLIVMDCTASGEFKNASVIVRQVGKLAETVKKYRGNMIILWHNTELISKQQKKLYKDVLAACI
jgi:hypothetical protein